jgi:hypothetical protein
MAAYSDFTTYANETGARLSDQPLLFETTQHFEASQHELFNYVSDIDKLGEWLWFAKKSWADNSNAEAPGQVGAVRVIRSSVGGLVREEVVDYDAPRMVAYAASDDAMLGMVTDHLGVLTCEPHPNGGTVVCWQAYGRLASSRAKAWGGKRLLKTALSNGMKNLERKFAPR